MRESGCISCVRQTPVVCEPCQVKEVNESIEANEPIVCEPCQVKEVNESIEANEPIVCEPC